MTLTEAEKEEQEQVSPFYWILHFCKVHRPVYQTTIVETKTDSIYLLDTAKHDVKGEIENSGYTFLLVSVYKIKHTYG